MTIGAPNCQTSSSDQRAAAVSRGWRPSRRLMPKRQVWSTGRRSLNSARHTSATATLTRRAARARRTRSGRSPGPRARGSSSSATASASASLQRAPTARRSVSGHARPRASSAGRREHLRCSCRRPIHVGGSEQVVVGEREIERNRGRADGEQQRARGPGRQQQPGGAALASAARGSSGRRAPVPCSDSPHRARCRTRRRPAASPGWSRLAEGLLGIADHAGGGRGHTRSAEDDVVIDLLEVPLDRGRSGGPVAE